MELLVALFVFLVVVHTETFIAGAVSRVHSVCIVVDGQDQNGRMGMSDSECTPEMLNSVGSRVVSWRGEAVHRRRLLNEVRRLRGSKRAQTPCVRKSFDWTSRARLSGSETVQRVNHSVVRFDRRDL